MSAAAVIPIRQHPLEQLVPLALDAVPTEATRTAYRIALDSLCGFLRERSLPFTRASVQTWRSHLESQGLAPATLNVRLAAARKLASEAVDNGHLDPVIAAGILRIKGVKKLGVRTGNWLTLAETQRLLDAPDTATVQGLRDRAVLALMVGCGLRRDELARLQVSHLQQRDGRWVLIDLVGKGKRVRTVAVPEWAYRATSAWLAAAAITEGALLRSISKHGVVGERMSDQAVYDIVARHAKTAAVDVAPHDLRRTYAKLAHKSGGALEQIQISLGHASIQTTERYLGMRQDLANAPGDLIGLKL